MEESASSSFKKRLKELRLACRWTQEKAAESCGIGYKLYQQYELGIKVNPGLNTLEKIAAGFGLGVHELLSPAPALRPSVKENAAPRRKPTQKKRAKRK